MKNKSPKKVVNELSFTDGNVANVIKVWASQMNMHAKDDHCIICALLFIVIRFFTVYSQEKEPVTVKIKVLK